MSKKPLTDPTKASKSGDLDLIIDNLEYRTIDRMKDCQYAWHRSELVPYFRNGDLLRQEDFSEIRDRAWDGVGYDNVV